MQPPLLPGTVLQNRYRLVNVLGQGGFGRTYLAEDLGRFQEQCVLKEFTPPAGDTYVQAKSRELFQREAQILYRINHPQVPKFHTILETDDRLFLVQDYVQGHSYRSLLDYRLQQGQCFGEAEVRYLFQQLLPVLSYLHGPECQIIHRDISPENIMLRESDRLPVLIDFGAIREMATRFHDPDATTVQATTVGKSGYAPSEQIQTGRANASSDLYALAATALVLLTGREPQDLLDDRTLTWHWDRYATISPEFGAILKTMLSYRPDERYPSARLVQQALQELEAASPIAPASTTVAPAMPTAAAPPTAAAAAPPAAYPPAGTTGASPAVPSTMATVVVGRSAPPPIAPNYPAPTPEPARNWQEEPRGSMMDNPWAVTVFGVLLVVGTGVGSWSLVNQLLNRAPGQSQPSPTVSASITPSQPIAPSPSSPSPTSQPSVSPVVSNQRLNLQPAGDFEDSRAIAANETLVYRFTAQPGQNLAISVDGRNIIASLLAPDGDAPDRNSQDIERWNGTIAIGGEYALQMRVAPNVDRGDYKVIVSLSAPTPAPTPEPTITPEPVPAPTPAPSPVVESPSPAPPSRPQSRTFSGTTQPQVPQTFGFEAQAGQQVSIRVPSGLRVTVLGPNGPLPDMAGVEGSVSFDAPVPGNYGIEVSSDLEMPFAVDVTVR